jgi:sulfur dioxygenase
MSLIHSDIIFRQLYEKESSTYTYLLADPVSKEAVLIDPVLECVERDANLVRELGLNLLYAINTHCHADHITGTGALKLLLPEMKSMISAASGAAADVKLNDGDTITFGTRSLKCVSTPGHTEGCMSFILDDNSGVFTGDTLLYRGCGRTDFQGGSASDLYDNVRNKLFALPEECRVFPAHDYGGRMMSTISEEKQFNPRLKLTNTKEQFVEIMVNLNLPLPKKLEASLPANLRDGADEA